MVINIEMQIINCLIKGGDIKIQSISTLHTFKYKWDI